MRSAPGKASRSASRWLRNTSAAAGTAVATVSSSASAIRLERKSDPQSDLVGPAGRPARVDAPVLDLEHDVRQRVVVGAARVHPVGLVAVGVEAARDVVLRVDVLDAHERLELVRLVAEQPRVDVVCDLAVAAEHLVG